MSLQGYLLALLLSAVAVAAQAVEFDEKIKAPRAASGAEVRARMVGIAARVNGPNAMDALATVRDRSLARERFDARWMLGALIDARAPLGELEELGLESRGEGKYVIELGKHPEWNPMTERLVILSDPGLVTALREAFIARGFRPSDLAVMENYVQSHDLKRARDEAQLSLIISAGKMAKKLQRLKRLDDNFMASFFYQKSWQLAETDREWVAGLLDALEPQAQRVLASYFAETTSTTFISPEDVSAAYKFEREVLLQADLEQKARTAFKEGKL